MAESALPATADFSPYRDAVEDVLDEIFRARVKLGHTPMNSAHEGWAVIYEEFMIELGAHVWAKQKDRDLKKMRTEAIQTAAMAVAFAVEVCTEERGRR